MLEDCAPEVLEIICKKLSGGNHMQYLSAAAAVASSSALAAAAREQLGREIIAIMHDSNAVIGLAWAAELSLGTGTSVMVDGPTGDIRARVRIPPRVGLRFLPLANLLRMLQSDKLWVTDEEDRYKAAAAWLRCWRWWDLPSDAASKVLGVIRPERMAPCARQRAYDDAAEWPEARNAWWPEGPALANPLNGSAAAGTWTFGFSVPLPSRTRLRDLDRDGGDAEEQEVGVEEDSDEEEDEEAQLRFVWGSSPLWVAGAYLHAEVSSHGEAEELTVGLTRIRGAEPRNHPIGLGPGSYWVEGA